MIPVTNVGSEPLADAKALLAQLPAELAVLAGEAERCRRAEKVSHRLQLLCKHFSGDVHSCLDYAARGVARFSGVSDTTRVWFPISDAKKARTEFVHQFDSALPGVRNRAPGVFTAIEAEQCFVDVDRPAWLWALHRTGNWSKHNEFVSSDLKVWLYLRLNDLHIVCEKMNLGIGAEIRSGGMVVRGPGNFDGDRLPEIHGVGSGEARRLVDFELRPMCYPMEWALVEMLARLTSLIDAIELALGEGLAA